MKHLGKLITVFFSLFLFCGLVNAQTKLSSEEQARLLKPFPDATKGMEKHVLFLPEYENELDNFKLELIAGKTMSVDCNIHTLSGRISAKNLTGWGYTYYVFETNGNVRSTMRACPDNIKEDRFVSGPSVLVRYNSKLPVVIYAPKGYDIKYSVWRAGEVKSFPKK